MKLLVKARILKFLLLIKTEIQLIQKFPSASFRIPFIRCWTLHQKRGGLKLKTNSKLHSVPVSSNVMIQVGFGLCGLPIIDGYRDLMVCIGYFSKWSEAKSITEKQVLLLPSFCTKIMCRHGCFAIQIRAENSSPRSLMSFTFLQVFNSGLQVPIHSPVAWLIDRTDQ